VGCLGIGHRLVTPCRGRSATVRGFRIPNSRFQTSDSGTIITWNLQAGNRNDPLEFEIGNLELLDRNSIPVELLPVAPQAEIIEHRLQIELGRALEVGPALDADLRPPLEVDEFGAEPQIQPLHALDVQPDEVAQAA